MAWGLKSRVPVRRNQLKSRSQDGSLKENSKVNYNGPSHIKTNEGRYSTTIQNLKKANFEGEHRVNSHIHFIEEETDISEFSDFVQNQEDEDEMMNKVRLKERQRRKHNLALQNQLVAPKFIKLAMTSQQVKCRRRSRGTRDECPASEGSMAGGEKPVELCGEDGAEDSPTSGRRSEVEVVAESVTSPSTSSGLRLIMEEQLKERQEALLLQQTTYLVKELEASKLYEFQKDTGFSFNMVDGVTKHKLEISEVVDQSIKIKRERARGSP